MFSDPANQHYRLCLIERNQLKAVLFIHKDYDFSGRQWLIDTFGQEELSIHDRRAILAGRPLGKVEDKGAIVCSCFQVGENTIKKAIAGGCTGADALGAELKCGTNCGSCIPELKSLIAKYQPAEAVE
jgi:assimilatory nitrate reductase catalytic subunit